MKKLLLQAFQFFGLSGIGWVLDFSVFIVLGYISKDLKLNNFISSWVGVTFVFIFSTKKIFENHSHIPLKVKYIIYILYQLILIMMISRVLNSINTLLLTYLQNSILSGFSHIISKIMVTPITMILNFIVMKNIIERI